MRDALNEPRTGIGDKCDDMKCDDMKCDDMKCVVKNNLQVGRDGSTEM